MCGITGIYNFKSKQPVDRVLFNKMCDAISHRGPDAEGTFYDDSFGISLGHRRLSIIDIAGSVQPMSDSENNFWIIFNGEIYNYLVLKAELLNLGYKFRTSGDTEVIINLYKEFGERAFEKMNGIFSFAIYNKKEKSIILVRDHFGVKPMYFSIDGDRLVFGSEIKTIIADKSFDRKIDLEALTTFLTLRYNPSPQTLFYGINKLSPGYYLKVFSDGTSKSESFWNYSPATNKKITEADAIEQYSKILEESVKRQMVSDVPVGLMLSGGVDSAIIGYFMQKNSGSRIKTFTVGFPGEGDYNELIDAKNTSDFIGSEHFPLEITKNEYLEFFFKSFYYTEEPIAEPTIPALYYVSKLASQQLKVVLSGQGADEPLAGYKRYFGEKYLTQFSYLLKYLPFDSISSFLNRNERLKRAAYANQFTDEIDRFLGIYTIFTPEQKKNLLLPELSYLNEIKSRESIKKLYDNASQLHDSLSKILYIDTRMYLSDDLLIFGDKISMANSLELRVPFLDIELIKFLESLPSSFKLRGFAHKWIHKKSLEKFLPKEIIYRKKRGFATPVDSWLQYDLGSQMRDMINSTDSACSEFFNINYINKMIDSHQNKNENYQRHLFALLSFEIWYKSFFQS